MGDTICRGAAYVNPGEEACSKKLNPACDLVLCQEVVHQKEAPIQIGYRQRSLSAERDARMGSALLVKPQKVGIVRNENASVCKRECQLLAVTRAHQVGLDRSGDCDPASTQRSRYGGGNVLVEMEPNPHLWPDSEPLASGAWSKKGAVSLTRLFDEGLFRLNFLLNFLEMIEVVGQRRVHFAQSQ
jgi:hypothetical protein